MGNLFPKSDLVLTLQKLSSTKLSIQTNMTELSVPARLVLQPATTP